MKRFILFLILSTNFSLIANAQNDSSQALSLSAYIETYYGYDFANPDNHLRPNFIYSHNRHNEVNLNLGFVKAAYQKANIRANMALMVGTYANANLAPENGVLKNILEANVGIKITKNKNLWLDAGIFSSHIGFESAISKDCWTLTRSILAENSPYYESGAKISYNSDTEKWFLSALLLNGWQRIQRLEGNNMPAFGHQITFKPNATITLNSSSFIGSDTPDAERLMRYFHNFYGIFQLNDKFGLTLGFDVGFQQKTPKNKNYNVWYSPVLMARYAPTKKLCFVARSEFYSDKNQVIMSTKAQNGFQTFGNSLNIDYHFSNNLLWRIEYRNLSSKDAIFQKKDLFVHQNNLIISSLAIVF
jgi:hypothetical protein